MQMPPPIVNVAIKAARRAGQIIMRYVDRVDRLIIDKKGRNDFVSEVDRIAEQEIIAVIQQHYPEHKIIGEETGGELSELADGKLPINTENITPENNSPDKNSTDEIEWIIDPLDGTTNYLHQFPHFAISIAVRQHQLLQHAVIFDPLRNELYTASRGSGAQLNNRRIRVADKTRPQVLIATGLPIKNINQNNNSGKNWPQILSTIIQSGFDIRIGGSAALDLAYVACGRVDGYYDIGLKSWDIAAGALLVREAGGLVTDFAGQQNFLTNGEIIAANEIFTELYTLIRQG